MTKQDPPSPIKKRVIDSDAVLFTSPMHAHGIDAAIKAHPIKMRAPYLLQRCSKTDLMTTVSARNNFWMSRYPLHRCQESP